MSLSGWTVKIPDTVTSIGGSAFSFGGISKINFPEGLQSIGNHAFYNNKLTELNLPNSLTYIGATAFNNNKVTDPNQMWIYKRTSNGIDYSTLIGYAGSNKKDIIIPEEKNGIKLTSIGSNCFSYLGLSGGVKLPSSITTIGSTIFRNNYLKYVDNGDGDTSGAFVYARKSDGSIDKTRLLSFANSSASNVKIPDTVKRIEDYAFYYTYTQSVEIPEGVTYIGSYAFGLCRLKEVTIPSTVTSIGGGAFEKFVSWTSMNGDLTKIVNKTGRSFNWQAITKGPSTANFEEGTIESWYGDIEVVKD